MAISNYWESLIAAARRVPYVFHARGRRTLTQKREVLYAYQLGPLTAAVGAHAVTNVWQGIPVIPLADSDEVHALWVTPHDFDSRFPVLIRWLLLPNNGTSAATITTTYDTLDLGATHAGSDVAADGATVLSDTIEAVTAAQTTTSVPFFSQTGVIDGATADFDLLFLKLVVSGASSADRLRVVALELYYTPLTAKL